MINEGMMLRSEIQTSLLEEGLREVKYKLEVISITPSKVKSKSHFEFNNYSFSILD
jgi:hypothetical protein